jgi:glycosyltransferase involved in cell wall biosynthesis
LFGPELKKTALRYQADLFIGHNLGALPAVVLAAKKWNAKAGFDAEDFHRGEAENGSLHWKTCQKIEDEFIPQLNYLSAASPLIEVRYRELYPDLAYYFTLRNVFDFPKETTSNLSNSKNNLQIFWFSQFVGKKRGIELLMEAMKLLPSGTVCLNLLGNVSPDIKAYVLALARSLSLNEESICFHPIMPLDDLIQFAIQFDIGLASELSWCESRDLCETNKIFTYLLAGLAIGFTDTKAQVNFLNDNPGIGFVFNQKNAADLADHLMEYIQNPEFLQKHKQQALQLAQEKFNWSLEKKFFLGEIAKILS